MTQGINRATEQKLAKISGPLKSTTENMLKAWPGTNIAKRIHVNDVQDIEKILVEYRRLFPEHLPHGVVSVTAAKLDDKFFMATDGKGSFHINEMEINGFNSRKDLIAGLAAIHSGQDLTAHMEYGIENLWHEIIHNRQTGLNSVKSWSDDDPKLRIVETLTQYIARLTYSGFMRRLGRNATHQEWVMANGYGYKDYVRRFNTLLNDLGIQETIRGDLFNIVFNQDLSVAHDLLLSAISKKTHVSKKQLDVVLLSVVLDERMFNKLLNELKRPN